MDTSYLSYQFLNELMRLPDNVKAKYKQALALIIDTGMAPERAFEETGFTQAFEKERGRYGESNKN